MISRRFILFAVLLTLSRFNVNAQANTNASAPKVIQEKHFNMNCYDDNNCYTYGYDLTVPYLVLKSESDKDIRAIVNDSLAKIAKKCYAFATGNPAPNFKYNKTTCTPKTMHPDITLAQLQYKATRNDPDFLSMYVEVEIGVNEGGKGEASFFYYFNVDFKNNSLIYDDSLFSPLSKNEILKLFVEKSDSSGKTLLTSISESDSLRLDGFNIENKHLVAHYSTTNTPPVEDRYHFDVPIDLDKIKDSFNSKYSWIH